ncbi:MAG: hypothetical protein M1839_008431 [Geoglossum umbratile]|nr:MAG: hypothetical protein M1839_008431 [Geoglossum umbratile]
MSSVSLEGVLTYPVEVRDFAYPALDGKGSAANWANFSVDAAVAVVNALKEAKQMGQVVAEKFSQLTPELEALLKVGELAIAKLPRLLSLQESELELELGQVFTASPNGNPALHVQLTSLLMAAHVAGEPKLGQSPLGATRSPQSSPLGTPASGTRRSYHRRSSAGSGYQSLFPGSPSPKVIVAPTQGVGSANCDRPADAMFQSANRKIRFSRGQGEAKGIVLTAASGPDIAQDPVSEEGSPETVELTEQIGGPPHTGNAESSGSPAARPVQSTNLCPSLPENEDTTHTLLKRAAPQPQTGVLPAPTGFEPEEAHISLQQAPLDSDLENPLTTHLQSVAANQNVAPTVEELENAMARAVLLAKQKGIPPPDWEQLMMQDDYFPGRDLRVTIDPELHRLTRIQEEGGTDLEGASSGLEGEVISAQASEDLGASVSGEAGCQKALTQAAAIDEASVVGTLEHARKQESADTPTDIDLFSGLDVWLAARELASAEADGFKWKETPMEGVDFGVFGLSRDGPADAQEYEATDTIRGPPVLEELDPSARIDRSKSDGAVRSDLASISCDSLVAVEVREGVEADARQLQPTKTPEGLEPLFP